MPSAARLAIGLCAMVMTSCATESTPWYAELEPDSPCYRVNLADGLDEDTTDEVQDLFACVNHHGHLQALAPTAQSLESASPGGSPAAIELARAVNAAPDAGVEVDLAGALSTAIGLIDDRELSSLGQNLALEAIYAENHLLVRRDGYDLGQVGDGAVAPLAPVLPEVAAALDADGGESLSLLADVLEHDDTRRWMYTIDGWIRSEHPDVAGPVGGLVPHLGEAIMSARSPENDRWSGASGHSMRDLVEALARDDLMDEVSPELATLLGDAKIRRELPDVLVALHRDGHLQVTPGQATFLTQIDNRGGSLQSGEDSALVSLLRLLHATNQPMQCRVNLFITEVDVNLGNLAVTLLRILADQDPDDVQSAASFVGTALGGYGIGDGVMRSIAESGACPAFTVQVADDLYSLERLGEPGTRGLTHTLINVVKVIRDGDRDQLEPLVDVISKLDRAGAIRPIEEVLRDGGNGDLGADLVSLVGVMDDPGRYGIDARGEAAMTLEDLIELLVWVVEPGEDGRTGWQQVRPLLTPALDEEGTWTTFDRLGPLLASRSTAFNGVLELVPAIVDADPELSALPALAPALREPSITEPTLRLLQTREVWSRLLADAPEEGQDEVPLAFAGRLVVAGSVDDLLKMVRAVLYDVRRLDDDTSN